MKNLQQIEKHLADKLQNVPVPDVDQSWEQMRKLLDNEMPEPAGAAWSGNRKWWWMGITAVIIMVATWLSQELNDSETRLSSTQEPATTPAQNDNANKTTVNTTVINKDKKETGTNQPSNINNNTSGTNDATVAETGNPADEVTAPKINTRKNNLQGNKTDNKVQIADESKTNQSAIKRSTAPKTILNTNNARNQAGLAQKPKAEPISNSVAVVSKANDSKNQDAIVNASPISTSTAEIITSNSTSVARNSNNLKTATIDLSPVSEELISSPADEFDVAEDLQPGQLAVAGKTDRAFAREVRKKSMKADNRRLSRSSMRGKSGDKEHDITFAAGLALPQSFAISGQQTASYNINAGSSRITDYLPAPFFQYHINNKLFLQTEFHFQSPQHTQRLLLSRNVDSFASSTFESNVHLEKLYYFNVPFNVYYSPVRNFFIGGGLQYSSLLSGVASFEQRSTQNQTVVSYNSVTRRFKDDSVAAVFSPSEWRYQFDANYYFNRFTLGLRFNQAMRDFVATQPGANTPFTRDRNRSFLLYLRFNIWEERKRD